MSYWRFYDPAKFAGDDRGVLALHQAMEKRLGRSMDLPELDREPVIASVVRVDKGRITHCIFLEAQIEACAMGEEPLTGRDLQDAMDEFLLPAAARYGLRIVRSFLPEHLVSGNRPNRMGPIARTLAKVGFKRDEGMVQFYRWLRPAGAKSGKENGHR